MKAEYINPFVNSTVKVFKTMLGIDPVKGRIFLKEGSKATHDISGIIGLSGRASGSVVLCFSRAVAFSVAGKLLNAEVSEVDRDVTDAIGELANMIAGAAKADLNKFDFDISISIPSVVVGVGHTIAMPHDIPTIVIPFSSENGEFSVEVSLKTPD